MIRFILLIALQCTIQFAYSQLTLFSDNGQAGTSATCAVSTIYAGASIPNGLDNQVSSIQLQQGFMATLAENGDGTGAAYTFIAAVSNVAVNLSNLLNNKVSFIRVLPIRNTKKKGVGNTNNAWIDPLDVSWFYDWGPSDVSLPGREYALMAWGRSAANNTTNINNYIAKPDVTHLLSFNEPDNTDQSNIPFGEAVNLHKNLAATGLRLGSPAPTESQATVWLTNFMDSASRANVKVDFVAVHWYDWGSYLSTLNTAPDPNGVFNRFKNYINNIYAIYKKPIWITEFNANRNTTSATHEAFIALALPWLEAQPFVERYAYFFPPALPPADASGNITPIGNAYKNQVSNVAALNRNWDNTEHMAVSNSSVYEGEQATFTLIGTNTTTCGQASNGAMAVSVTGSNKIIFHDVTVNEAGSYNLSVAYYANATRNVTIQVNGNAPQTSSIPASGDWCYNGAPPGSFQRTIPLTAGKNRIMFTSSPIIDKINIDPLSVLPVNLLSFYALPKPNGIELFWKTVQEVNNRYFELLRSNDGNNFGLLARINGNNAPGENTYNHFDRNPLSGVGYYRLRQVDADGKTTTYKTIAVNYGAPSNSIRLLSSSKNDIVVLVSLSQQQQGTMVFTDLGGRRIHQQNMSLTRGTQLIRIPMRQTDPAVGVVGLITKTERLTLRVMRLQ